MRKKLSAKIWIMTFVFIFVGVAISYLDGYAGATFCFGAGLYHLCYRILEGTENKA